MQTLGSMFHNFNQDWPRAVFWWRMSAQYGAYPDPTKLANCYWQMGCEDRLFTSSYVALQQARLQAAQKDTSPQGTADDYLPDFLKL